MTEGLWIALIGGVSAVIAAAITAYLNYRAALHSKEKKNSSVQGKNALKDWIVISGKWQIKGQMVRFISPDDENLPYGLILSKAQLQNGVIETTARILGENCTAHLLFGYNPLKKDYFTAGLGGYGYSYVINRYINDKRWEAIIGTGNSSNFDINEEYKIRISVQNAFASLSVNDIEVLNCLLPASLGNGQIGLFAWGKGKVEFRQTFIFQEPLTNPRLTSTLHSSKHKDYNESDD